MADEEHFAILKQGVEAWNRWRESNPGIWPDLNGADLRSVDLAGARLTHADFRSANLAGVRFVGAQMGGAVFTAANLTAAKFSGSNLFSVDFDRADLTGAELDRAELMRAELGRADLAGAILRQANLRQAQLNGARLFLADLSDANLEGASITETNFTRTTLTGTNLSRAVMLDTIFADCDLSTSVGLDSVRHIGPSTIGIDTIYRSQARIPEAFLRGAGVPDDFITFMRSLVGQPWQYFSCFISHSAKDMRFCDRLCADLEARHVRKWYFEKDARWGELVWRDIDRSIQLLDKVVVVCSKNSLQSGPVVREIDLALNREHREGKSVLFPITIDRYVFDKWDNPRKADVLAKVVGDFRDWNRSPGKYELALTRLMLALKA